MGHFTPSDTLHRLIKQAIDSGAASSIAEAEALFRGYRVVFAIDASDAPLAHHQAALLTGIALARRVFLGGVTVVGNLAVPLLAPLPLGETLQEAAERLGAQVVREPATAVPCIFIGGCSQPRSERFRVPPVFPGFLRG